MIKKKDFWRVFMVGIFIVYIYLIFTVLQRESKMSRENVSDCSGVEMPGEDKLSKIASPTLTFAGEAQIEKFGPEKMFVIKWKGNTFVVNEDDELIVASDSKGVIKDLKETIKKLKEVLAILEREGAIKYPTHYPKHLDENTGR